MAGRFFGGWPALSQPGQAITFIWVFLLLGVLCRLCGCDHETNHHNSESLFDRIKRFAVEGIGHGRVPRGPTGKHDRSPNGPAAMKVNPIE